MEIIIIGKKRISMSIISTSRTVRGQPLPRFHVEAWFPFRNCELVQSCQGGEGVRVESNP